MQIIIVHPRLSRARAVSLRPAWLVGGLLVLLMMVGASGIGLTYLALRNVDLLPVAMLPGSVQSTETFAVSDPPAAGTANLSGLLASSAARSEQAQQQRNFETYIRQNIDTLAIRLGELQARLMRLDALGERVGGMVGIGGQESSQPPPGRGGALPTLTESLSLSELSQEIEDVTRRVEQRGDQLSLIESELVLRHTMARLLPTAKPLEEGLPGSRFGWRIDPFTGRRAMHEGVDFTAPKGTPIVAAGAGVVVFAGWHPQYGRQVDLDHGDGVLTRYGHASRLYVKVGDIVHRGERIGLVGSTGRSTGPHLHFEVRVNGKPRDPIRFLRESQFAWRVGAPGPQAQAQPLTKGKAAASSRPAR